MMVVLARQYSKIGTIGALGHHQAFLSVVMTGKTKIRVACETNSNLLSQRFDVLAGRRVDELMATPYNSGTTVA